MLILIVAQGPDKGRIYEWADDDGLVVGPLVYPALVRALGNNEDQHIFNAPGLEPPKSNN